MIITIRQYDPQNDPGLFDVQNGETVLRAGSTDLPLLSGRGLPEKAVLPEGIWIARSDERAIGAILFGVSHDSRSPAAVIHGITVDEPFRRRGIGGALMYKAELYALSRNIERIITRTSPDNEAFLILLKKCWYSVISTDNGVLTMEKTRLRLR
jgi:ribosomal protein S18 acetylase RimI-like enzyme